MIKNFQKPEFKEEPKPIQEGQQEPKKKRSLIHRFFLLLYYIFVWFPSHIVWEIVKKLLDKFLPLFLVLLFYKNVAPWIVKNWGDKLHPFLKWILTIFHTFLLVVSLTACGTSYQKPADIGMGTDDLKMSECEPCKMTPFYKDGQWLIERK